MSDSTERLNDSQGTARLGDSTARMDAGTARMDGDQSTSSTGAGVVFADGQAMVLNGKNCVIESLISMGSGEAVVYKVQIDGKPFALKHYKPNTPLSVTAKKVLTKIRDNPKDRVVKIIEFGKLNDQDYEIMEYAEGGALDHYLRKAGGIKDVNKLKGVVKQINEGLQQLHGFYHIIYQDLKPENIYFKDAARSSLVLADFGISSVMQDGSEEVEVIASNTDLYGAPELARKGNNTKVIVTPAVDYFALGITLYELWLGEQPFKEIKATTRERRIQDGAIDFPLDMPDAFKRLIAGLIEFKPKDRMGNEHVQKWLKGEALASDNNKPVTIADKGYDPPLRIGNEFASNPKEIAALMEKYPEMGKVSLYDGFITDTLKKANDSTLYTEIKNVISQYGNDQQAGLAAAVYTLDPETPFKSRKGKACKSGEEIADAIMDDQAHYMDDLKNLNASLYIYITITGGLQGKEVAKDFCNYFRQYSPQRALTLIYLKLQGDGGIPLGSKRYLSTDEIAQEKNGAQIDLIKKAVREKDSPLLVWIADEYRDYVKSTDEFGKLNVTEQFFLLGLLPFLSFKELTGSNGAAALKDLIDNHPGRADLFEAYVKQGLPLKGPILDSPTKTPIDYVVCNFNKLKDGSDTVNNLLRLLCKLGADINENSGDATYPLLNAFNANNDDLVNLLLELGADRGKYNELVAQRAEKERIKAENERIEKERQAELQRQEQKRRDEQARVDQVRQAERKRLERAYRNAQEKEIDGKNIAKKLGRAFIILLSIAPLMLTSLMCVLGYRYSRLHSFFGSKDISMGEAIGIFVGIFIPFALFHLLEEIGVFKVIMIIVISILLLAGIGMAVDFEEVGHFGWITLVFGIISFVMGLVKPTIVVITEGGSNYDRYNNDNLSNMESYEMEHYIKKRSHKTIFKTILTLVIASIVLLTTGLIVYNSQKNTLSIPVGVTSIEYKEYARKHLVEVKIPGGVTTIGKEAFKKNKLSDIEIPASVTSIGDSAFANNKLTTITIGANVTLGGDVFDAGFDEFYTKNGSSAGTYKRTDKKSSDWSSWHNNYKYQYNDGAISIIDYDANGGGDLVIPKEISGYPVTIIGKKAIYQKSFTRVIIPDSVTIIEEQAFSGAWSFQNSVPRGTISDVSIGTGVTTIGKNAFENNKISTITFPNSVTSIGINAFSYNPVTSIRIGANVELGDSYDDGILGKGTGFNGAYNNGMRAGTYTRPNTNTTTWTRR
jgi:serine/threonine protein kinase